LPARRIDLVPLAERLGALQLVRVAMAVTVLAAAAVDGARLHIDARGALPITAVYLLCTLLGEAIRRFARVRGLGVLNLLVLLDGVYLAVMSTIAAGPGSGLIFLVYVHLIAVTLLASWRTGLKLAAWQSLLMVMAYWITRPELGADLSWLGVSPAPPAAAHSIAVTAAGFWFVALATAAFGSLSERALRRGKSEVAALAEMSAAFEGAAGPQEVGEIVVRNVVSVFQARRAAVLLTADRGGWATSASAAGATDFHGPVAVEGDATAARCWEAGEPVLTRVLTESPGLASVLPDAVNVIVVPMVVDGDPVGVLAAEWIGRRTQAVPRATVEGIAAFARHAAMALRSAWLLAEIERQATVDSLTELANRRVFEAALSREVARSKRSGQPMSLVIIDIDHFKRVNDDHGHQVGDAVLREVGTVLAAEARETDLPARYGGEEFCVVLPGCPIGEAVAVADRLRAAIAAGVTAVPITASAGVATLPDHAVDGAGLVAAADSALYDAKRSGRNRTCQARPDQPARLLA
jgi:diguanylate cyclase (GGDEF)-like protein